MSPQIGAASAAAPAGAVSQPAGHTVLGDLTHLLALPLRSPRALARRLADGPGVWGTFRWALGPLGIGIAVGWRPAMKREAREMGER